MKYNPFKLFYYRTIEHSFLKSGINICIFLPLIAVSLIADEPVGAVMTLGALVAYSSLIIICRIIKCLVICIGARKSKYMHDVYYEWVGK